MPQIRQEKMARVVKQAVSQIITRDLQDPRIQGLVSVTSVRVSPDLKNADVHLSVMGGDAKSQKRTFSAIKGAVGHIQFLLGKQIKSRVCPHLTFYEDERLKKTLETMNLISKASKQSESEEQQQ